MKAENRQNISLAFSVNGAHWGKTETQASSCVTKLCRKQKCVFPYF